MRNSSRRGGAHKPGHPGGQSQTGRSRDRHATGNQGERNAFHSDRRTSKPAAGTNLSYGKPSRSKSREDELSKKSSGANVRTGTPSGKSSSGRIQAGVGPGKSAALLKMGRIKGEWMDVRLPDKLMHAPLQVILQHTPLPIKLASRMQRGKGLLLQGSTLRLHLFPKDRLDFPPDWMELNILYEDEFTLVVGKPAGIEVHPSEHGQRRTLAHGVAAYYEMSGQELRVRHIHRIDKDTTGPVLYAKNEFAHYQYDSAMREKRIERIYLALVEGVLTQDKGTIDKPIGQDRHHSTRRRVSETGDAAVTHYEVVERFADHTLVRLRLETGRTHQIRVHMAAIGHPLAGDGMYGGTRKLMARQALHGEKLIWPHPWSGEKQQVRAPLPDDFAQALEELSRRR